MLNDDERAALDAYNPSPERIRQVAEQLARSAGKLEQPWHLAPGATYPKAPRIWARAGDGVLHLLVEDGRGPAVGGPPEAMKLAGWRLLPT